MDQVLVALSRKYGENFRPNLLVHPLVDIKDVVGEAPFKITLNDLLSEGCIETDSSGKYFLTEKGYLRSIEIS
jgi:hypothetical protein